MTTIDDLEGAALADAICVRRGWIYAGGCKGEPVDTMLIGEHSVDIETTCFFYRLDGSLCAVGHEMRACLSYRPDQIVTQMLELGSEDGWRWKVEDFRETVLASIETFGGSPLYERRWFQAEVYRSDFANKAEAWATAGCRAFLKAKAAGA